MLKIATHNSATGEKPSNILSWLSIPFARTQSKTIREQFNSGCRLFDIRVKKHGKKMKCAHGIFETKRTAESILNEIDTLATATTVYVALTYEGTLKGEQEKTEFINWVEKMKNYLPNITWCEVCVKYTDSGISVDWLRLIDSEVPLKSKSDFIHLDGRSWHTYLPIPYLWNKIYTKTHDFNENIYTYVDFL